MINVADVPASSQWYQELLGATSGHGGADFEMLMHDGELMLMLHRADGDKDHDHPSVHVDGPMGKGVWLYLRVGAQFDATVDKARAMGVHIIQGPTFNKLAHQDELWVHDPDGYTLVLCGPADWDS